MKVNEDTKHNSINVDSFLTLTHMNQTNKTNHILKKTSTKAISLFSDNNTEAKKDNKTIKKDGIKIKASFVDLFCINYCNTNKHNLKLLIKGTGLIKQALDIKYYFREIINFSRIKNYCLQKNNFFYLILHINLLYH